MVPTSKQALQIRRLCQKVMRLRTELEQDGSNDLSSSLCDAAHYLRSAIAMIDGTGPGRMTGMKPPPPEDEWKWGILHELTDRPLGVNRAGEEVWGGETVVLFDTKKEAVDRIALRTSQYPTSDWRTTRAVRCKPGRPATQPEWDYAT